MRKKEKKRKISQQEKDLKIFFFHQKIETFTEYHYWRWKIEKKR